MNSYSFGISGSWWLAIALLIAAIAFSYYTYRTTVPPITGGRKTILMTLRSIALALLLFAIFEPVITIISGSEVAPKVAVLLDNSLSTGMQDASGDRAQMYRNALENANLDDIDEESIVPALFSDDVLKIEEINPDSIAHSGQLTNISGAIRWAARGSREENIRAALLISDGAFNSGNNPVYETDLFGKPVFVIGIGDTTQPKDVLIESILTNEVAYVENPVPVNVNIRVNGYPEGALELTLKDNGETFEKDTINIHPERKEYTAVLEYMPKTEGNRKITAEVSELEEEITYKNNYSSEFIKVLKNKRNIAIFAGAPNPDISFVKHVLADEKGVNIQTYIQKKGAEFYGEQPNAAALSEVDIIMMIGFPISSTPQQTINMIRQLAERGKSLFFIASKQTDYRRLKPISQYLPFEAKNFSYREFMAVPDVKSDALSSPLLRVTGTETDLKLWNSLPPVFRTEVFVEVKPESEIVAGMKVNNVAINEPLILTRSFQNHKSVAILGYGLYRWKLLGYAADVAKGREEVFDLYDILMKNTVRWLTVSDKNKMIRIKTTKDHYTSAEPVEFLGQVYDAAFTPIDNAEVLVKISGGEQARELKLNSLGNGRYSGNIEGLAEGDYAYTAYVNVNENRLGSESGRFSVGEINIEYQQLRMNSSLLRNIAERSGGKFYLPEDAGNFTGDLESLSSFRPLGVTTREEHALWNLPWLLIIAILCFATEWFLRKRYGMV